MTLFLLLAANALAGTGVALTALPPPVDGHGRAQVVLLDPSLPADFRAVVGTGGAAVTAIHPVAEPARTVLAFDQSGSFKPHWAPAFDLAGGFADGLLPGAPHTVEVATFGVRFEPKGDAATPAALHGLLDRVEAEGATQPATRLKGLVSEAVRRASAGQPLSAGGVRQVVVFSDAGEESAAWPFAALEAEARDLGVRVHTVVFAAKADPQRLDEMRRLSEATGGSHVLVGDPGAPGALKAAAAAPSGVYWLDLAFCGVPAGDLHQADTLSVEVHRGGARLAFTEPWPLRQHAAGDALSPCTPPPVEPVAPVEPVVADPAADPLPRWTAWLPVAAALGAGALGLLLLPLLLLAVRRGPAREPAAKPKAPPPPPPAAKPAPEKPWSNPLEPLPETHLVVVHGPPGLAPRVRVHRSPFSVGADPGADLALALPEVSGKHASLQLFRKGALFVVDEGSTNGTFVDGRRLAAGERVEVKPGQTLGFSSKVTLRVERPDATPERRRTEYAPVGEP